MKKLGILIGILVFCVSVSVTVILLLKGNSNADIEEQVVSLETTELEVSTEVHSTESLFDSANASVVEQETSSFVSNPDTYVDEVTDIVNEEFGELLPSIELRYVETIDTGVHNHIWEVVNTDIIVNVSVTEDGDYTVLNPAHRYGSDYSIVWFEVEPADRMDIYNYLYEEASVSIYKYDSSQLLTDVVTGESFDYGLYARTEQ